MELDRSAVFAVAFLAFGMAALPFAAAQQQPGQNMTQYAGDDAIVLHDGTGNYMAIIINDQGEPQTVSGTVSSMNELEQQSLAVCLYRDNIDQQFIDMFQPGQGLDGEPLTGNQRRMVLNTATCYQDTGGIF